MNKKNLRKNMNLNINNCILLEIGQQNPQEYLQFSNLQIVQHPAFFSQYRLSGHNGHQFYDGFPQQQLVHQFYSGPIHEEQEGQQLQPDIPIFLIETSPILLSDFLNYKQPELINVKFIVFTSVRRESQNPFLMGYSAGEVYFILIIYDPIWKTTSLSVQIPQKYKSNDMKSPFCTQQQQTFQMLLQVLSKVMQLIDGLLQLIKFAVVQEVVVY
ncbi:unnamed protein product [Paramecium sonneborni]|uniref:Uncharacterized protein n=1 Tax=Paramecium sonneborni TaxID=65129 RepID=A0A8S1LZY4_9CILI|nr:unnamed protein product [Paramecium sonneborni]